MHFTKISSETLSAMLASCSAFPCSLEENSRNSTLGNSLKITFPKSLISTLTPASHCPLVTWRRELGKTDKTYRFV